MFGHNVIIIEHVAFCHIILQDVVQFASFSFCNVDFPLGCCNFLWTVFFFLFWYFTGDVCNYEFISYWWYLTLCITSLNFFDFSMNCSQWKTLSFSVSSDKQLRFIWDTSVGKFCLVNKFWNDDADCCKVKMFPCTISLKVLVFDIPIISSWLILVSQPSQIFDQVRLWNKSSIEWVHEKRDSILQHRFPFVVLRLFLLDLYWPFVLFIQISCLKKHYWISLFIFNHKVPLHKFFT